MIHPPSKPNRARRIDVDLVIAGALSLVSLVAFGATCARDLAWGDASEFVACALDLGVPHATTCVALTCDNGVVMAGDRRATSGNLISHRSMEKVVEADRHSGVAIAGAAGPAMEMIRMFNLARVLYSQTHPPRQASHKLAKAGAATRD